MLTAADTTDDLVDGLALGADDYLPKPFRLPSSSRASARWRAAPAAPARRCCATATSSSTPAAARRAAAARSSTSRRRSSACSRRSWRAGGQAVSTEELLERVWDEHADPFTNTVRMSVMTLRRKLGDPPVVKTVTGVGYRV